MATILVKFNEYVPDHFPCQATTLNAVGTRRFHSKLAIPLQLSAWGDGDGSPKAYSRSER